MFCSVEAEQPQPGVGVVTSPVPSGVPASPELFSSLLGGSLVPWEKH